MLTGRRGVHFTSPGLRAILHVNLCRHYTAPSICFQKSPYTPKIPLYAHYLQLKMIIAAGSVLSGDVLYAKFHFSTFQVVKQIVLNNYLFGNVVLPN